MFHPSQGHVDLFINPKPEILKSCRKLSGRPRMKTTSLVNIAVGVCCRVSGLSKARLYFKTKLRPHFRHFERVTLPGLNDPNICILTSIAGRFSPNPTAHATMLLRPKFHFLEFPHFIFLCLPNSRISSCKSSTNNKTKNPKLIYKVL